MCCYHMFCSILELSTYQNKFYTFQTVDCFLWFSSEKTIFFARQLDDGDSEDRSAREAGIVYMIQKC